MGEGFSSGSLYPKSKIFVFECKVWLIKFCPLRGVERSKDRDPPIRKNCNKLVTKSKNVGMSLEELVWKKGSLKLELLPFDFDLSPHNPLFDPIQSI